VERAAAGARKIVVSGTEFLSVALLAEVRGLPGVISEPRDEELGVADAGVTEAFAGVASSGSVCVTMGPGLNSATSLLMPLNIVLLAEERLVGRPRELFAEDCFEGLALRRDFVLISGPSATADMGPLVRGVHGPHRLHVLLLEQG
jgi:L-lactate dehydrogenase complex protein LldG